MSENEQSKFQRNIGNLKDFPIFEGKNKHTKEELEYICEEQSKFTRKLHLRLIDEKRNNRRIKEFFNSLMKEGIELSCSLSDLETLEGENNE